MHLPGLGKGERLTNEAPHPLAQGAVPTFHMIGQPAILTDALESGPLLGEYLRIGGVEVGIGVGLPVGGGHQCP